MPGFEIDEKEFEFLAEFLERKTHEERLKRATMAIMFELLTGKINAELPFPSEDDFMSFLDNALVLRYGTKKGEEQ